MLEDLGVKPQVVVADLGYRAAGPDVAPVQLIHRGRYKTLTSVQRKWLKRRQAIEPLIGHAKHDHGMARCWLKGSEGDALHAVLCAAGFNLRWLLRAVGRLGLRAVFLRLQFLTFVATIAPAVIVPRLSHGGGHHHRLNMLSANSA